MAFLTEWMTNIIIFILLATIFDMLLPQSSMQKYTKMVIGLLLIAIILTPLFQFISTDFEKSLSSIPLFEPREEKDLENLIEMKKKEIQASQHAYILEQMAVQLRIAVEEELIEQFGLEIAHIHIQLNEQESDNFPDNIEKIIVQLSKANDDNEVIEVVQMVEINTGVPLQSEKRTNQEKEIAVILGEKWNMAEKVEVMINEEVAMEHA